MTQPVIADPLVFLRATLDAAEEAARLAHAVDPAPWYEDVEDGTYTNQREGIDGVGLVRAADNVGLWDREASCTLSMAAATTVHIALHDPDAVLRRIAADRKQLELHAAVPDHGRFSERGCDEWADCGCDPSEPPVCRSCRNHAGDPLEAPCATVENLAEGWGWTE